MAEYVLLHILARERKYLENAECQRSRTWQGRHATQAGSYRLLSHCTLGVLGAGDIGSHVRRTAEAFGMRTLGCTRSVKPTDPGSFAVADITSFLGECDYVVNLMPSTETTRGMLDKTTLAACKP